MKCGCCHKCHPALQKQLWCGANHAGLIQLPQFAALSFRIFNGFDGIVIEDIGSTSKLTFHNVSEADYGNYTCIAMNKLGSANTSIILYGESGYTCGLHMYEFKQKNLFLYAQEIYFNIINRSKDTIVSILLWCYSSFDEWRNVIQLSSLAENHWLTRKGS